MSDPWGRTSDAPPPVCPYLGLVDDPDSHFAYPSSAQRCHASGRPAAVESAKQARDCLTEAHVACSRYRPPVASVGAATVSLAALKASAPHRPGGRPSGRRSVNTIVIVILAVVAALGGIAIGWRLAGTLNTGAVVSGRSPAAGASAAPGSPTAAPPSSAPTFTPSPSPSMAPSPTPAPTSSPAPTRAPSRSPSATQALITHQIKRGETLTIIAAEYGVTVAALQKANGITNPSLIVTGQILVIPAH
ncbi:MAG: LysM peptidoglycan-binding domain-containing protein [Candidatus Limnocylindrales bacterium]